MRCPFLKAAPVSCSVNGGAYVPSSYERGEYCMSNRHKLCPFYCTVRSDGKFQLAPKYKYARAR